MTELCKLGLKYGTDKYPSYTPFYDILFNQKRLGVTRVLELGIGTVGCMGHVPGYRPGASLRMWRDYFPNAQITGVDIDQSVLFEEDRINTIFCDQHDLVGGTYGWDKESFDIIVDDASHTSKDQHATLLQMLPYVKANGIYIIEDACDKGVHNASNAIRLEFFHQYVECRVPDGSQTGRLLMVHK